MIRTRSTKPGELWDVGGDEAWKAERLKRKSMGGNKSVIDQRVRYQGWSKRAWVATKA